jgi:hypothetical protein
VHLEKESAPAAQAAACRWESCKRNKLLDMLAHWQFEQAPRLPELAAGVGPGAAIAAPGPAAHDQVQPFELHLSCSTLHAGVLLCLSFIGL